MITSAFTCTGPYAILIMMGVKRVENRSAMPVPAKGRCAVSCSKSFCKEEFGRFVAWAAENLPEEDFARLPTWGDVKDWPGKVVGCCDYEGTVSAPAAESSGGTVLWDEGYPYWWKLSEVVSFDKPIPCRGNVGMWQMPSALAAQVTAADSLERSLGESTTTTVDPGEVFSAALGVGAKAIIVAHNHPSGDATPSVQDHELTVSLKHLGETLGVPVLDHLILGGESFTSI